MNPETLCTPAPAHWTRAEGHLARDNSQKFLLVLLLLCGKLRPAEVCDHIRPVANGHGALGCHGQVGALHDQ